MKKITTFLETNKQTGGGETHFFKGIKEFIVGQKQENRRGKQTEQSTI